VVSLLREDEARCSRSGDSAQGGCEDAADCVVSVVWFAATGDVPPKDEGAGEGSPEPAEAIKASNERVPPLCGSTMRWPLEMNKSTFRRRLRLKEWQVRKHPIGQGPKGGCLASDHAGTG
jgi:hypothetical protein